MDKSPTLSQASSSGSSTKIDWVFLKEGTNDNFKDIVTIKMPYNIVRTSHNKTNCNSTIESYNKIIKLLYTNYISYTIF